MYSARRNSPAATKGKIDSPASSRKSTPRRRSSSREGRGQPKSKSLVAKASSFDEVGKKDRKEPDLSLNTEDLFGRVVRSNSAPRQRDLISATLIIPGQDRHKSKEDMDLLLESFNSLNFRTTFPSRKVLEEQKSAKKVPAGPLTPKVGPCKCKACTLKREQSKEDFKKDNREPKKSKKKTTKKDKKTPNFTKLPALKAKKSGPTNNRKSNFRSPERETEPTASDVKKSKSKFEYAAVEKAADLKRSISAESVVDQEENFDIVSGDDVTLVPEEDFGKNEGGTLVPDVTEEGGSGLFGDSGKERVRVKKGNRKGKKETLYMKGDVEFVLERSGTESTCCRSFCFEEMKTKENCPTLNSSLFGFLDFSKEMGGLAPDRETTVDLNRDGTDREIIKSRIGSRMDSNPGSVIQWKRGPMLGRGAFGTVWCGLTITGELVAVKQSEVTAMNIEKAQKEYEKIQSEVELLKSLNHPNIVSYLGTSLSGRTVSIFMQYIPGGSVAGILKKFGPLAEPVFARYTRQIIDGIAYLHSKNVIHRDIKGSNLMLMPNGTVKLIDFGCAKKIMNLNCKNADLLLSMKGTPYWMAPEVINETGHGPKSDVWSVGCSVFEMATARPPWSHLNKYAALFAISSGNTVPKLSEKFSEEARGFVAHCLIRNPEKRPDASKLFWHPFIRSLQSDNDQKIHDSSGVPRNSANRFRRS